MLAIYESININNNYKEFIKFIITKYINYNFNLH